jgi:hypothetical protein
MSKVKVGFKKTDEFTIDIERVITQMLQQNCLLFGNKARDSDFAALNAILYSPAKSSHVASKVCIAVAPSVRAIDLQYRLHTQEPR